MNRETPNSINEAIRQRAKDKVLRTAARAQSRAFVIGSAGDGFCTLVPIEGAPCADDQNISDALRFADAELAFETAWARNLRVFEIIEEGGKESLQEVLIHPDDEEEAG